MRDSAPTGDPVKDERYEHWVRLNLPHARTIAQRIGRSLEALDAFGERGDGHAAALARTSPRPFMRPA